MFHATKESYSLRHTPGFSAQVMSSLCVNKQLVSSYKFVFQVVDVVTTLGCRKINRVRLRPIRRGQKEGWGQTTV